MNGCKKNEVQQLERSQQSCRAFGEKPNVLVALSWSRREVHHEPMSLIH